MAKIHAYRFLPLLCALPLVGCSNAIQHAHKDLEDSLDEDGNLIVPMDVALGEEHPTGFHEGTVLVRSGLPLEEKMLGDLDFDSYERLSPNSSWYSVKLNNDKGTVGAVKYLRGLGTLDEVDYDYWMKAEAEIESIDVSSNPMASSLPYIDCMGIGNAWGLLKKQNKTPGGSNDVIVAVIDTGVDYNHIDLRHNIWTNSGEIPGNGIDDDGNGYIDDVRGWNCVGNNNDPMDDNGHGTHVAGIVAAENNNYGTVGVAYNCKIMPLKAGASSGSFQSSDIAEAITYAYMNGASVINMSFGGGSISLSLEEALGDAYQQCVLVAAAGNDSKCNKPRCAEHALPALPSYPGALPYVIGVMSCDALGTRISPFSNYDHSAYDSYEYEAYACGENIPSTWPNNRYAALDGTSMASPVVAGIAALLRSAYPDRNAYSNKFIHSQICNTGNKHPLVYNAGPYPEFEDEDHSVADAERAMYYVPRPSIVGCYDYYAIDSLDYSSTNNADGFINAGETIKFGIELTNRGGKASDVHVVLDTARPGDQQITDPYLHFINNEFDMEDIGTYSVGTGGKTVNGSKIIDVDNGALIYIDPDTPNNYTATINVTVTYKNGLSESDHTIYSFTENEKVKLTVANGYVLPSVITEDTLFPATRRYVLKSDMTIAVGAHVTFEAGCNIEVGMIGGDGLVGEQSSLQIKVYGELTFSGTQDNRITVTVNPLSTGGKRSFNITGDYKKGYVYCDYCDFDGLCGACFLCDFTGCTFVGGRSELFISGNIVDSSFKTDCTVRITASPNYPTASVSGNYFEQRYPVRFYEDSSPNWTCCNNVFASPRELSATSNESIVDGRIMENNVFMQLYPQTSITSIAHVRASSYIKNHELSGFLLIDAYRDYAENLIDGNVSDTGAPYIFHDPDHHDASLVWPYIKDIQLLDNQGKTEDKASIGEDVTARVTFSTDVDTSSDFNLSYGSAFPYSDYRIEGNFVNSTVWEGQFRITSMIEGGTQRFNASGGTKSDNPSKEVINNAAMFSFDIDSSSAMSMNLQAITDENGVTLSWAQDDYDTLMGYNVYRSESKDGNYVKINPTVIPVGEEELLDDNVAPGKTYWYTFTVVSSDMSESSPAGKVSVLTTDTIAPTAYHTPVNQGYLGNNLVLFVTASDNIAIDAATVYYRTLGETGWGSVAMSKQNNRYSGTIFGGELSLAGLEYYIVVSDGRNQTYKGSAENPYRVTIKDASSLSRLGDVDGDGLVTTKDALMIVRAISGDLLLTDDQFQRADLNHDEELSSVEALRILQYVNGKINDLEM